MPKHTMPLKITITRVVLAPIFLTIFLSLGRIAPASGWQIVGITLLWLIFALIGISDLLDGAVARKYQIVSDAGKILDPLADVFSHVTYFICFVQSDILLTWLCIIIVYRELIIISLRMLLALKGIPFPAGSGGKLKTTLFTAGTIGGLLVYSVRLLQLLPSAHATLQGITTAIFMAATVVSYLSLTKYITQIRKEKLLR